MAEASIAVGKGTAWADYALTLTLDGQILIAWHVFGGRYCLQTMRQSRTHEGITGLES